MYQKNQKYSSENYPTQLQSSHLAQRSTVQAKQNSLKPVTQSENEKEVNRQNQYEASRLGYNIANIPVRSPHKQGSAIQAMMDNDSQSDRVDGDIKVERVPLTPGQRLGYKATVLEPEAEFQWPPPKDQSDGDWAGIYLGSKEVARGYLVPIVDDITGRSKPSQGYLAEIYLKKELEPSLQLFYVKGKYMARGDISGDTKAKKVKEKADIPETEHLIPSLGKKNMIYQGGAYEENGQMNEEIAIPHDLAKYTEAKNVTRYTYKQLKEVSEQDRSEASPLQLKEKSSTVTSQQQKLGVLQAKMNDSWVQRKEKASQFSHNIANIPINSPHKQSSTIQAKMTIGQQNPETVQRSPQPSDKEKDAKKVEMEGVNSSSPPFAYKIQAHKPPDSNLCLYFAYYHYMNGQVDKNKFISKVIQPYMDIKISKEEALEMFYKGNDPAVYSKFGLSETNYENALNKERLIIADVTNGHFYTLRSYKGNWWNYDSYHQTNPKPIGDKTATMEYLQKKGQTVWA